MPLRAVYPGFGEYDHKQECGAFRPRAALLPVIAYVGRALPVLPGGSSSGVEAMRSILSCPGKWGARGVQSCRLDKLVPLESLQ